MSDYDTTSLFIEYSSTGKYTLKHKDFGDTPSLRRLYLDLMDVTEFQFGETYFESYDHWLVVSTHADIEPYVIKWRKELAQKMEALGITRIAQMALNNDSTGFQAAKFLANKGWEGSKRGRPSKEDIDTKIKEHEQLTNVILASEKRIQKIYPQKTK